METKIWYRHGDLTENGDRYCAKCDLFVDKEDHFERHGDAYQSNKSRADSDAIWFKRYYEPKGYRTGTGNLFI